MQVASVSATLYCMHLMMSSPMTNYPTWPVALLPIGLWQILTWRMALHPSPPSFLPPFLCPFLHQTPSATQEAPVVATPPPQPSSVTYPPTKSCWHRQLLTLPFGKSDPENNTAASEAHHRCEVCRWLKDFHTQVCRSVRVYISVGFQGVCILSEGNTKDTAGYMAAGHQKSGWWEVKANGNLRKRREHNSHFPHREVTVEGNQVIPQFAFPSTYHLDLLLWIFFGKVSHWQQVNWSGQMLFILYAVTSLIKNNLD